MTAWPAVAIHASIIMLCLALGLVLVRLTRGPSAADRIIAVDTLALVAIGLVGAVVALTGEPATLDAAVVLALVGFLGTIALARYLESDQGGGR
jgi:multicomponent Na+:H+ antiporter subunit F